MKILVIGDNCEDIFRYGKVERIAPEAPIPIIIPEREEITSGMAGNVVRNLIALKNEVDFITNIREIKKTRYIDSKYNYLLLRVDENDKCERIDTNILNNINFKKYDAVVISDYDKGFLNEDDIKFILNSHPITFLDTKKTLGDWVNNIFIIKINYNEYEKNKNIIDNSKIIKSKIIITRGKYGCDYLGNNYPTKEVPVKDISGAGDTFLAGLVTKVTPKLQIKKHHMQTSKMCLKVSAKS